MAFVLMGSTLAQTDNASQLNAGAWGSTDEIFVPDPAVAIGQFFVGACSAAQSDMFDTTAPCYKNAVTVQDEILKISNNPGSILNELQVLSIKIQATQDACNFELLFTSLDNRLSNLSFTISMITNVISQFFAGISSQDF